MMRHRVSAYVVFFVFIFLACRQSEHLTIGGIKVPRVLIENAGEEGFDYTGSLAKALQNDRESLGALLSFTLKTETANAPLHGDVLLELLNKSGDSLFSKGLAGLNEEAKLSVWNILDGCATNAKISLSQTAPLTLEALTPPPTILDYEGLYLPVGRQAEILLCNSPENRYALIDESGRLNLSYKKTLRFPYPGQPAYINAKGFITRFYGATTLPANCQGFFVIKELQNVESKNFRNTCIPYELWAMGTEPFWYAMISSREGIMEFLEMGEERTKNFAFSPAISTEESHVYTAINEDSGDNIRIEVLKIPCSDGMSDRKYPYQVNLTYNGRQFRGCGFSFEARSSFIGEN